MVAKKAAVAVVLEASYCITILARLVRLSTAESPATIIVQVVQILTLPIRSRSLMKWIMTIS